MTPNKKSQITSIIIPAIIASLAGLSLHIIMLKELTPYITSTLNNTTILKPPYPIYINISAYITAILPGFGLALLYYFIRPYFSIKSKVARGILLGLFVLLIKGELIRQPIMNILVGNPISIALLQQSQIWLTSLVMSLLVVFLMPESYIRSSGANP
jgi:hypothetical protein